MGPIRHIRGGLWAAAFLLFPAAALAQESMRRSVDTASGGGASVIWIFANISYAGMRAQNSPSAGWRVLSFIFGFPGTLLSYIVVEEGGERMYGIDVPRCSQIDAP